MTHLLTLNEDGNNIEKHFQIRGVRNIQDNRNFYFNIYYPRNINQKLIHQNLFDDYTHRGIHLFRLCLLRAIKSYNLYHNWYREDLIQHIENINHNLDEYRNNFLIPNYNWLNNKLNNYKTLFNYMRKLNAWAYFKNNEPGAEYILRELNNYSLFDFAFHFPNINNLNSLNEEQKKEIRLKYFNNLFNNLTNINPSIFNFEGIQQIRLKNGNIQNFKHIFDIPTPYTIEDFMNKIYIPDPEKMPPILNRDIDLELELDFPY